MKSLLIAALLSLLPPASAAPRKLQGCSDPTVLAKGLKALSDTKWSRVSISNIQSLWPTHLNTTDCDISKTCTSMVHEGRIIDGHVECAEVFDLSLTRNEEGKETERLSDVVVHYTASTRAETVSAARSLSIALGLVASDATTIGRADQQQFQWNVDHELVSLDLRWSRLGDNWNLYLSSAHYQQ